ncbi:MAG: CoA ester lyase [Chloroflexi bacterium]|nr:CoA ester lyase [Chloroflexota bacterium]
MQTRRALLFVPGDDRRKLEKAAALDVDTVILDLEDGVAVNRKDEARATVDAALRELDFGRSERLVRLNPVTSGMHKADIAATVHAHPDGYVLPKVETPGEILEVSADLWQAESQRRWPSRSIILLALIETALGVVNLPGIATSDQRLKALILGAEDLASDLGARRTAAGHEIAYARGALVMHAKAFDLDAIDTPYVKLADRAGLMAETTLALDMGYSGKLAIHLNQVEPIQAVFTPTIEEIRAAQRLIRAHDEHQAAGSGVFALDGKMVDMPMMRAAVIVLQRARAAGIDPDTAV